MVGLPCVFVFRVDFDRMENHSPKETRLRAIFAGETCEAALIQSERFIALERTENQEYKGYDGKTYPYWYVEHGVIGEPIDKTRTIIGI